MSSVSSALARHYDQVCYGKCGSTWKGQTAWLSCRFCSPLDVRPYCRDCGITHFKSAEHQEAAARARASMLGQQ